jgi:hypothetical protein
MISKQPHSDPLVSEGQPIRVFISDRDHPHCGETGVLTGKVIMLFGKHMAEVKLDHCRHGTDGCFVSQGQIRRESDVLTTGGKKRRRR